MKGPSVIEILERQIAWGHSSAPARRAAKFECACGFKVNGGDAHISAMIHLLESKVRDGYDRQLLAYIHELEGRLTPLDGEDAPPSKLGYLVRWAPVTVAMERGGERWKRPRLEAWVANRTIFLRAGWFYSAVVIALSWPKRHAWPATGSKPREP